MPTTVLQAPPDFQTLRRPCQNRGRRSVNRASITLHKVEQANLQSNPIPCLLFYSFFIFLAFFAHSSVLLYLRKIFFVKRSQYLTTITHSWFVCRRCQTEFIISMYSYRNIHSGQKCLPRVACLWSKTPMFQGAGIKEGGEPFPLAFQYLILMT